MPESGNAFTDDQDMFEKVLTRMHGIEAVLGARERLFIGSKEIKYMV